MSNTVLIYTRGAFSLSETFIYNQFETNSFEFKRILVYAKRENENLFPIKAFKSYQIDIYPTKNPLKRKFHKIYRYVHSLNKYSFPPQTYTLLTRIIKENDVKVVHCNFGNDAIAFIPLVQKLGIRLISHFHGYDASDKLFDDQEYSLCLAQLFQFSAKAIVPSKYLGLILLNKGISPEKLKVVQYGIETNYFNSVNQRGEKVIRILHVGRIVGKKGVPDLIRTLFQVKQNTDVKFIFDVIGEGYEEGQSKQLVDDLQLKNTVTFHGSQPRDVVKEFMSLADIYILNSRIAEDGDTEGLPNSILEAMACGCAVISTRHSGIPEAIDNEINGLIVEEKNNMQLCAAILKLLSDPDYRKDIGKNAQNKARKKFDIQVMINEIEQVYREVIEENESK